MALEPARTHCRPATNLFQSLKSTPADDSSPRNLVRAFLSLFGQLLAGLTAEQAGWVLNCQAHDIPALVNAWLLKLKQSTVTKGTDLRLPYQTFFQGCVGGRLPFWV
jgi:hypothetical protein